MKLSKLGILALLAAGSLIAFGAQAQDKKEDKPGDKPPGKVEGKSAPRDPIDRLAETLNLTEDQKAKIKPIMLEEREKSKALFMDRNIQPEEKMKKRDEIRKVTTDKVAELLTPEQKEKWEKMRTPMRRQPPAGGEKKDVKKDDVKKEDKR
jgi:periplasmic protein CpxP/Spy